VIPSPIRRLVFAGAFVLAAASASAAPITLDFENLGDLDSLTDQFPDLFFSNALVLSAGSSLNEFEFPARSGTNVISDDGGSLTINFAQSVYSLSGYLSYVTPITLTAYDSAHNVIGTVLSAFGSNYISSDTPNPNELMAFSSLIGISSVTLSGSEFGGSFVLDDFTYDNEPQQTTQVPEPSTFAVIVLGAAIAWSTRRRRFAVKSE
jgi:hypothetical protein